MKCYIITTCTSNKKYDIDDLLRLKNILFRNYTVDSLYLDWSKNISNNKLEKYKAINLYCGVQWTNIIKSKNILLQNFDVELLVMSAGMGLINSEKKISSYSCTFSANSDDSIKHLKNKSLNISQKWWNLVNKFDLDKLDKNAYIFLVLSNEYINATSKTIDELIKIYEDKLFIISCSKSDTIQKYKQNLLNFNTSFNNKNRGTFISINQRAFYWLSQQIINKNLDIKLSVLNKVIDKYLENEKKFQKKRNKKLNEYELNNLIEYQIKGLQIKNPTQGLGNLRKNGFACEQKRYSKFFNTLKRAN